MKSKNLSAQFASISASLMFCGCFYGNTRPIIFPDGEKFSHSIYFNYANPGKTFKSDSISLTSVYSPLNFSFGYIPKFSFGDSSYKVKIGLTTNGIQSDLSIFRTLPLDVHLLTFAGIQSPILAQMEEYKTSFYIHNSIQAHFKPKNRLFPSVAGGVYLENGWYWYEKGVYWYQPDRIGASGSVSFPILTDASIRNIEIGFPAQLKWTNQLGFVSFSTFIKIYSDAEAHFKTALKIDSLDEYQNRLEKVSHPRYFALSRSPSIQFSAGFYIK